MSPRPGAETRALKLLAVGRLRVSFGECSGKGYPRELSGIEGPSKSLLVWVDPHEGGTSSRHLEAVFLQGSVEPTSKGELPEGSLVAGNRSAPLQGVRPPREGLPEQVDLVPGQPARS